MEIGKPPARDKLQNYGLRVGRKQYFERDRELHHLKFCKHFKFTNFWQIIGALQSLIWHKIHDEGSLLRFFLNAMKKRLFTKPIFSAFSYQDLNDKKTLLNSNSMVWYKFSFGFDIFCQIKELFHFFNTSQLVLACNIQLQQKILWLGNFVCSQNLSWPIINP